MRGKHINTSFFLFINYVYGKYLVPLHPKLCLISYQPM